MGELDRFAQASPKWMNSAAETVIGVDLYGSRKVTLKDSSGNEMFTSASSTYVKLTDGTNVANVVQADGEMGLVTVTPGHISTANSTTATLTASGTFTGTAEEIVNHGVISVVVKASHASATSGFSIQFSPDGTNWDSNDNYTIAAATGKSFSFQAAARYFRVVYTNGTAAQTYFRLQTILKPYYVKPSSHRIGDVISEDDDAELTKTVVTAKYGTTFTPINASRSGNLQITDAENGLAISKGEVSNTSFVHKFGNAFDFDTADGEVTVWDGADDGETWEQMAYQYSSTADIDSISSSNVADTEVVTIVGQTADGVEVTQNATLNGQTRVALGTPLYRIYRGYNSNGTLFLGHIIVYVNTAITAGVPDDNTKIRLIIDPSNQQTEMALYTIPAGYTGYMRSWYASISGASKASNYVIKLKTRETGKVFRTKHTSAISDTGTSAFQYTYNEPEVISARTDIEMTVQATAVGVTGASVSAGFDLVLVAN